MQQSNLNNVDALVLFADGFEEIEAIGTVDILRRGGMKVISVSINEDAIVTGAHGVQMIADTVINEVANINSTWIVLPGGMPGAKNLYECNAVHALVNSQISRDAYVAAICASPAVVLAQMGVMDGRRMTCYPGFESLCRKSTVESSRSVVDGHFVTANGPSSVANMCYDILKIAKGEAVADEVMQGMLITK